MPFVLSPIIMLGSAGMWLEGAAYEKKNIYSISKGKLPPVNYDEHVLRPHSLTHLETPAHTIPNAPRIEAYFQNDLKHFFGKTTVIKLPGNKYESKGGGVYHWIVSKKEIELALQDTGDLNPSKVFVSTEYYPINKEGFHDPNYVLTLSQEAAEYLINNTLFNLFGTSWKSTDFNPGKPERPLHNTIFKKALILENLNLKDVPQGIYFLTAFPLPLNDASESPVVPVLFTKDEIFNHF